jgi:HTH-type transcriptional regulator, sugar sensing transcriptional regulator
MKNEGRIQALTDLGLTMDQARLYLALVQGGPATARQLSSTSKIARPDVYRIIPTIEKQGMVEKLMTKPISYQAVSATLVLSKMMKRKTLEQKLLIKETEELLDDLSYSRVKEPQEMNMCSVMVFGRDSINQRVREGLTRASTSVYIVTSKEKYSESVLEFTDEYKKALRKGTKINIAVERHVQRKRTLLVSQRLAENPNFKVKFTLPSQPAIVTVIDDKEAFITMAMAASPPNVTALWSKNSSLVALARSYFDCTWNNTQ